MLEKFGDDQSAYSDIYVPRWYVNNLSPEIREIIRKEMSKYSMFTLSVRGKEFDKSQSEVTKNISAFITLKKIPVTLESVPKTPMFISWSLKKYEKSHFLVFFYERDPIFRPIRVYSSYFP
jgi:hypothetical protein